MGRPIDLAKAKAGDKIRFRRGSSAIIDTATFERTDVERGNIYTLHFEDGTLAAFAQDGTAYGEVVGHERPTIPLRVYGQLDDTYDITSMTPQHRTSRPLSLSRAFNVASQRPGNASCRHPALLFQTENRLRGIAGRYVIPGNRTASEYEDHIWNEVEGALKHRLAGYHPQGIWSVLVKSPPPAVLRDSWNELLRLNPQLKGVKVNRKNGADLLEAHTGVTSGFNVDDINFYLEQLKTGERLPSKQSRAMPVHGDRIARVEAAAGKHMYWVASPQTVEKIEARFRRRGLFKPPSPGQG